MIHVHLTAIIKLVNNFASQIASHQKQFHVPSKSAGPPTPTTKKTAQNHMD